MKNLTRQNPRQLIVAQELINKVKSKCCGIKDYHLFGHEHNNQGVVKDKNTIFANGAVLDDQYNLREKYNLFTYI